MAKRKRHRPRAEGDEATRRVKHGSSSNVAGDAVRQSLLAQFYPTVLTLREYLLSKLPTNSKVRRKKVTIAGQNQKQLNGGLQSSTDEDHMLLRLFLDTTLVGVPRDDSQDDERATQWNLYPGRADASELTVGNISGDALYSQSEVCFSGNDVLL
jgi:hypothetical protein